MAESYVAIRDTFEVSDADLGCDARFCAGVLLNHVHRSIRTPGRGLSFEVKYQDRQLEAPDNEFNLEFHVIESDLKHVYQAGRRALVGACKSWIEKNGLGPRDGRPRVLSVSYFQETAANDFAVPYAAAIIQTGSTAPPAAAVNESARL